MDRVKVKCRPQSTVTPAFLDVERCALLPPWVSTRRYRIKSHVVAGRVSGNKKLHSYGKHVMAQLW